MQTKAGQIGAWKQVRTKKMIEVKVSDINDGHLKWQSLSKDFAEKYFQIIKGVIGEEYEDEHEEFVKDAIEVLNKEFDVKQVFDLAKDSKEVSIIKDEPTIF